MEHLRQWIDWHFWQFTVAVSVVLYLLLVLVEIIPRATAMSASYDEWRMNKEKIAAMDDWETNSNKLATRAQTLEDQIEALYISIPNNDQMSVILNCLQENSEGIELSLRQIKTDALIPFDSHQEQPVNIAARGDFQAMGTFINRIETSPFLIKVESVRIKREGRLRDQLIAEIDLRAIVIER